MEGENKVVQNSAGIFRSMPDLEPVRGMANGRPLGPRFGGDRRRSGMAESSVFARDRSETCNGEPNGHPVDARQKALGIHNRRFRDRSRIDGEVSGSNLPRVSLSKLEKACRKLKGGVVKPTELVMRLVQLVKGSKPRKCLDLVPEEVSESQSKGQKRRRKNIESESEACGLTGSGEGLAVGFREQMPEVDMEASDFGNNKAGSSSMDYSQINGYCGAMKPDTIANGEANREITEEGKKPKKYRATVKSVTGSVEEKSEPKRSRKGKVQCGESLGSHEAGDDPRFLDEADREGRINKRKRRNSGNAVADMAGSKITGSIADDVSSTLKLTDPVGKSQLANGDTSQAQKSLFKGRGSKITGSTTDDVSSTLKFSDPVNKRQLAKQDMSQEYKLLLKGKGRPKIEPLSNKRTKCSPRTNAEEQVAFKGITENGFLEKHKIGKGKGVKDTSDESKINGFYSPSKEKGTFTYAGDIGPLGEEAALSKVEKVEDVFEGGKQATLTHDKTIAAADLPMVEGIIVDKSSPTVGEDVSSVLTEAEGNKNPKGLGTDPEKPRKAWVSCDDCKKWRHISVELADHIETTHCGWSCRDNLDKDFADCFVPQEKSNAEINEELNISEISNCDKNDNGDGQVDSKALHREHNEVRQASVWTHISHSVYKHRSRKAQTIDEIMVCQCKPPEDGSPGCGDGCWNRLLNIECVPGTCPCGDQCSNQRFQKRSYANVGWFRCGKKGFGLQVLENVPCGTFIIEYVGEVLDMKEHNARQQEYAQRGQSHFYFMTLNSNEVIDACVKGNLGRYINHSCNPNCQTEKWTVNGEVCIGFFAVRDLIKGEEVTFDYNYVRFLGSAAKRCECGSADCRGFIGEVPTNPNNAVQNESCSGDPDPIILTEESEDLAMVVDCIKPSQVEKMQDLSEAKIQISDRVQTDSIVKKGRSSPSNDDKNSNDENKGTAKKLKRSKAVSTVEKHSSLSAKRLTINTSDRFEGVEEKLNEILDGRGGIAKQRDVAKLYLKLLVLTAASGDVNGEASGSTRDLSMVLDALLKTESRTVLMDIADKNGLQLLHNLIKQHSKDYRKTPIIRKLLKILHIFALKKVITSEKINSIPSRKGVESFEESICSLTFHADKEVKNVSRLIREDWGISPIGKSLEAKQTRGGSRVMKSYNSSWRKDKFPPTARASAVNRFKVPGKHVEGSMTDCGQDIVEKGDTQVRDGKAKKRKFEHDGEWNSSNEQISSRKGKEKSNLAEARQFPQYEKQCLDSLSKDPLLGDPSNVLEDNSCGPVSHSSIAEGGKWTQGSRRNIHNNNGRGHPRYHSSSRSTHWHDTPPHKTGLSPAANQNMLDKKIEPQHGAQLNSVTTMNSNQPLNSLSAPTLVAAASSLPHGNGVVDRPTGDILFPNTKEAIGVPLEVFDYVHGLPFHRSIENKATRGQHLREIGGVVSATPCRIPCEHFSMQPATNTMQPFHSSGGPATVYGFPLDPAAHISHPFALPLTAPVRGPSNIYSGIRPPQFHHVSQLQANQIHRPHFIHGSAKNDWAVVEQNNILEPEPPVPGLSPPHLPENNSAHYHSPFGPVQEINKMRDMIAKKDLPYKRDSCSILRNNGNNQDLSPNLSAQGSFHLNSNCDTENQSAKTCILDGLSTQMSCPVDGNTVSHASMNGATDYSSQRSSPLCMDGVCLNPEGKHSAEMVASLNSNHSKSSYPCELKGARKNNFSSKYDVKVEACGPIIDGQNFIHNGEHREISKFPIKSIESLRTDRDSRSSHDKGMPRSFDAAGRNFELQHKCPSNKVPGYVEDKNTDRSTQDTKLDRDSCPDGENCAPPVEGGRSSDIGKLE